MNLGKLWLMTILSQVGMLTGFLLSYITGIGWFWLIGVGFLTFGVGCMCFLGIKMYPMLKRFGFGGQPSGADNNEWKPFRKERRDYGV